MFVASIIIPEIIILKINQPIDSIRRLILQLNIFTPLDEK